MRKASSSFLILALASLFISLQSFAQTRSGQIITERVQQTLRPRQALPLAHFLRISHHEQAHIEVLSVSVLAQSFRHRSSINLERFGRSLSPSFSVQRQLSLVVLNLPPRTLLSDLALSSSHETYIESVSVEFRRIRRPVPTPLPNQLITLEVHRQVRGHAQINLNQLAREQGISLKGARIERIVVQGRPVRGRSASVQLELNNRPVGAPRVLSVEQRQTPFLIPGREQVQSNLRLQVSGDAFIQSVMIRIGDVRGGRRL
jgi:hypothetical protein